MAQKDKLSVKLSAMSPEGQIAVRSLAAKIIEDGEDKRYPKATAELDAIQRKLKLKFWEVLAMKDYALELAKSLSQSGDAK